MISSGKPLALKMQEACLKYQMKLIMNLSKSEFMLVVDATNGLLLIDNIPFKTQIFDEVKNEIAFENIDTKWEVKKETLLKKLEVANEDEYKELWKRIENFWEKRDCEDNDEEL